jgi:DNA repair protein RecO (recombination protein O)
VRRHGESSAIIEVFTETQGRHAGIVRGGAGRRMAPILQPGAQLSVEWRARLSEHLGTFRVEPVKSRAAAVLGDRRALAALTALCAQLSAYLPEREAHPGLYRLTLDLMDRIGAAPEWAADYARWELALLAELGFGLDLSRCASTGGTEGLCWVSPKSGRAVSREAGEPYADRLFPLPAFLLGDEGAAASDRDVADALALTGHFLAAWVVPAIGRERPPAARDRLAELFARRIAAG